MSIIREPAVSGIFYPDDPDELKSLVESFLRPTEKLTHENIFGIVAPHAGYVYSGSTAGAVYSFLQNRNYKTVIIISPSHQEYFQGISIYSGDAYRTPIGQLKVNKELAQKIISKSDNIFFDKRGHQSEHALEVQLPFLQMTLKEFDIVPIVLGDQNIEFVDQLGEVLSNVYDENILIVASSDMSHFHSKQNAFELDSKVNDCILQNDYKSLMNLLSFKEAEACGGGCIAALLKAGHLLNRTKSKVIARSDSGDVSGDNDRVVGYLSAVIY